MKNKLVYLMIIFLLITGLTSYKLYDRIATSIMSLDSIANTNSSIEKESIGKSNFTYKPTSENPDTYDNNSTDKTIPTNNGTPTNKTVPTNENIMKSMSIDAYILNLQTSTYIVRAGETTSTILRPFEATCNYNTAIKHLKLLNSSLDLSELEVGSTIKIPTEAFKAGSLYRIVSGDTFYKIAKENYPNYNTDNIVDFLISINSLPNKDCPLGQNIFLPSL
jgi:hypothetical protein